MNGQDLLLDLSSHWINSPAEDFHSSPDSISYLHMYCSRCKNRKEGTRSSPFIGLNTKWDMSKALCVLRITIQEYWVRTYAFLIIVYAMHTMYIYKNRLKLIPRRGRYHRFVAINHMSRIFYKAGEVRGMTLDPKKRYYRTTLSVFPLLIHRVVFELGLECSGYDSTTLAKINSVYLRPTKTHSSLNEALLIEKSLRAHTPRRLTSLSFFFLETKRVSRLYRIATRHERKQKKKKKKRKIPPFQHPLKNLGILKNKGVY